ncbi:MAG TPA: DUF433 domain-containing protein [Chloroflexia bacterium]|nr:DUF433 domain-containing protein [Chloroflexia bacterium]
MQIEDYFDFLSPDDIRLKGSRIGIESVLYEYIYREQPPEAISSRFPTLSLEQVYATILYYLHNRKEVSDYIAGWLDWGRRMREEQDRDPPDVVVRLRALKEARRKEVLTG